MDDVKYAKRFWSKLRRVGECLEWTNVVDKDGYGQCYPRNGIRRAHRMAFFLHNGRIDDRLAVLHRCDNPRCCNPSHLYQGTMLDNAQDCVWRKRRPRGSDHHWNRSRENLRAGSKCSQSRITEADVKDIRRMYEYGVSQSALARLYGVTQGAIWRIVKRKSWRHVA